MRPVSSPSYMWFNTERRRPQTELWESMQQQCGQVVNTDMKRKNGITNRFDLLWAVQTGWQREEGKRGGGRLLLFTSIPSTTSLLPPALSFGLSGYSWKSGNWKKHCNEANSQTNAPRGWSLQDQLRPTNLWTAQFSIVTTYITPPYRSSPSLHCSFFEGWKRINTHFFKQNSQSWAQTTFNAKQIKLNSSL